MLAPDTDFAEVEPAARAVDYTDTWVPLGVVVRRIVARLRSAHAARRGDVGDLFADPAREHE
jgi:hypothetical protein